MAPRYSLLDDEDQLGSLLEPDTLQSLRPTAYEMSPSPQPTAASMPDLRQRDPEVEDAWRGLELQKIHEAQKPSYGFAEGARDVIPTGLALALDAALNRGRGAAGILQGGMGEVANQQALRDKERQAAGDLAVKLHGRNDDPLAYLRAQTAMQNAGTAAQRVQGTAARFDAQGNPESDYSRGKVTQAGRLAGSSASGRINAEAELADVAATTKGKATEATTNAATDALAANPRALTMDQTADNERADAQLSQQRELVEQGRAVAAQNKKAELSSKYNTENADAMTVLEKARELQALFKGKTDLPGVGLLDANLPDYFRSPEDIRASTLFAEFQNPQFKDIAGRAVTGAEQARVEQQVGKLKSSNEDTIRIALDEIAKTMTSRLRGGSVGREDLAREILAKRHLADILDQQDEPDVSGQPDEPEASAQPQQRGAAPDPLANARELALPGEAVPASLGDTGGRRDVPPLPAGAAQPAPMVTVSLPGEPPRQVPRDLALRMRKLDPRLVIQ
jgi:hypothetical protein